MQDDSLQPTELERALTIEDPTPPKREIVYGDSALLKALKDYDLEPKESIRRRIDFFYSPYGAIH
jgi:hypothetical protein